MPIELCVVDVPQEVTACTNAFDEHREASASRIPDSLPCGLVLVPWPSGVILNVAALAGGEQNSSSNKSPEDQGIVYPTAEGS